MRPSDAYIFIGNLTIIGSDNSLLPGRRQAIIWTNDEILLIGPLGTNFSEILIKILTVSFKKMRLKGSSAKWQPFCLGLSVLKCIPVGEIDNKLSLVQVMAPRQIPYRPLIKPPTQGIALFVCHLRILYLSNFALCVHQLYSCRLTININVCSIRYPIGH